MRVPLSWLRDFAPFEGPVEDLAGHLSDLGLAVEGIERVGGGLDDIVVARVVATRAHPRADAVHLVDVDPGGGADPVQVVCGAFNFSAGDLVPLAPAGSRLPGGLEIGRRRIRGEWSEGMLCSGAELALSDDHDGILVLPAGLEPGRPLVEALGLTPDVVFDVDVTPNRPDALSMLGVARDLAARMRLPLADPDRAAALAVVDEPDGGSRTVVVESPDLCPRFTAVALDGVTVGPSPGWMASRLTLAGMRPINNVVDVSNYVMLELGQPNHPYDRDRLPGGGLLVRRARPGETVTTLDGVERRVTPDDCLICDAEGSAVGIGGVMGGASSEISAATTSVLLEVAWFDPLAIARTSKRLGLRTEASVRFERGVDRRGLERSAARFCQLATDGAAAAAGPLVDVSAPLPEPARVRLRTARVNAILGTSLGTGDIEAYLEPIGFDCAPAGGGDLTVTIPSWRPDSEREIDVVEEVARHHGYRRIERTLPPVRQVGGLSPYQRDRRRARAVLAGAGFTEAWSNPLVAPADLARAGVGGSAVELENPLAQEESVLRTSLLPGLLRAVATNVAHRSPEVALFEVGRVFFPPAGGSTGADALPTEVERVAAARSGADARDAARLVLLLARALDVDAVALDQSGDGGGRPGPLAGLHPTRRARVTVSGEAVGVVGEVDPEVLAAHDLAGPVAWMELDLPALLGAGRRSRQYQAVSRYPSADFDLAFAVERDVPAARVEAALREAVGGMLEDLWLFDVFAGPQLGEGRRSLAYRLRVAAPDHTLTDEDLADLRRRCIAAVESATGATLRG